MTARAIILYIGHCANAKKNDVVLQYIPRMTKLSTSRTLIC